QLRGVGEPAEEDVPGRVGARDSWEERVPPVPRQRVLEPPEVLAPERHDAPVLLRCEGRERRTGASRDAQGLGQGELGLVVHSRGDVGRERGRGRQQPSGQVEDQDAEREENEDHEQETPDGVLVESQSAPFRWVPQKWCSGGDGWIVRRAGAAEGPSLRRLNSSIRGREWSSRLGFLVSDPVLLSRLVRRGSD